MSADRPREDARPLVVVQINEPAPMPPTRRDLCRAGAHRWAYLVAGGQACGYCGVRR